MAGWNGRWAVLLAGVAVPLAVAGCQADRQVARAPSPTPTLSVTEYVGKTEDGRFFVAVAVERTGKVKAYACDGGGHAAPFEGTLQDERIVLAAADGTARIEAAITGTRVEGSVTIENANRQFVATPARRAGGLYTFTYTEAGDVTAASERGNTLSGKIEGDLLSAQLQVARGQRVDVEATLGEGPPSQRGFKQYRVIMLDTGEFLGNALAGSATLTTRLRPVITPCC